MGEAACPGWWPWDLLCVRQMELLETLVPEKSSALGELDVDTGYVGGHMGLGGWSFLGWEVAGEGCWGLVPRLSLQSHCRHLSSV